MRITNKHALIKYVNSLAEMEVMKAPHDTSVPLIIEPVLHERDHDLLFVGHLKRFHLHKRQLMSVLGLISRYLDLKNKSDINAQGRVVFFAGKASPEDTLNKAIIQLVTQV